MSLDWFAIILDTTAPILSLRLPEYVIPGNPIVIEVSADEDLSPGYRLFRLIDFSGAVHRGEVAYEGSKWKVAFDSRNLAPGPARFFCEVQDLVGNSASAEAEIVIPDCSFVVGSNGGVFEMHI